jgi:predicted phosphodiesterase
MAVKLIAVVSDVHFPDHDPKSWGAFRKWHRDHRPDRTVLLGDMLDMAALSRYPQGVGSNPQVLPELKMFVREANALADEAKLVTMITGNHEARAYKAIIEPIAAHIDGLVGFTLQEQCRLLGLQKRIEWFEESAKWRGLQVGQFLLTHGDKQSSRFGAANPARTALVKSYGQSSVRGHAHTSQLVAVRTGRGTVEVAVQGGHMQSLDAVDYNLSNEWTHSFTVLLLDTETNRATANLVIVDGGRFCYGRKVYAG